MVQIRCWANGIMPHIACTVFNDATWSENVDWRRRHRHSGCIYCSPTDVGVSTTSSGSTIYVLEMNNELVRLQEQERYEIARILAELTDLIENNVHQLAAANINTPGYRNFVVGTEINIPKKEGCSG